MGKLPFFLTGLTGIAGEKTESRLAHVERWWKELKMADCCDFWDLGNERVGVFKLLWLLGLEKLIVDKNCGGLLIFVFLCVSGPLREACGFRLSVS